MGLNSPTDGWTFEILFLRKINYL